MKSRRVNRILSALAVSVALSALVLVCQFIASNERNASRHCTEMLSKSIARMDRYAEEALSQNPSEWMRLENVPKDIVIYRYLGGNLQSWYNQFPVKRTDFSINGQSASPMPVAGPIPSLVRMEDDWFVIKSYSRTSSVKVVAGVRLSRNRKFFNPRYLKIEPMSSDEGVPVSVEGVRVFRIASGPTPMAEENGPAFPHILVPLVLVLILSVLILLAVALKRSLSAGSDRSYYRSRILLVMMWSQILTLAILATASVVFVYKRNEDNTRSLMSDKLGMIQKIVQGAARGATSPSDLLSPRMFDLLRRINADAFSGLSLYGADGSLMMTTTPNLLARFSPGGMMDGNAYESLMYRGEGSCIRRGTVGARRVNMMYAPISGNDGAVIAFVCTPYMGGSGTMRYDAVTHGVTIFLFFILLLAVSRILTGRIVDRMFEPLSEMNRKMKAADKGKLELIEYDRDDEMTTLVESYNRMVRELSESSVRLAQAERDKAWSEMARQVAHEIKNPLTPMKLQIQRLARMKASGDPAWEEKFNEVSKLLLDHIDVLTETANEFSTFAKLYTEEPSDIDLDRMLQEEISMFDSNPDVKFEYIGLSGAEVRGPRPQLVRAFVNLINNAVQAVEGNGHVLVALRNGVDDAFYEIAVEDDGPGVGKENIDKLFTPNFTTKSSGSGLGLAITRSILESCGATISYSASFTLGGACFTVHFPKKG